MRITQYSLRRLPAGTFLRTKKSIETKANSFLQSEATPFIDNTHRSDTGQPTFVPVWLLTFAPCGDLNHGFCQVKTTGVEMTFLTIQMDV